MNITSFFNLEVKYFSDVIMIDAKLHKLVFFYSSIWINYWKLDSREINSNVIRNQFPAKLIQFEKKNEIEMDWNSKILFDVMKQLRKGPKKGLLDISNSSSLEDEASPLVMAVASSPRITRKRLGSNSNAVEQFKDDNLPGWFY